MNKSNYKTLNYCADLVRYHLALAAQYRRPVMNDPILKRLNVLARERVEAWNGEVIEINGEADH